MNPSQLRAEQRRLAAATNKLRKNHDDWVVELLDPAVIQGNMYRYANFLDVIDAAEVRLQAEIEALTLKHKRSVISSWWDNDHEAVAQLDDTQVGVTYEACLSYMETPNGAASISPSK